MPPEDLRAARANRVFCTDEKRIRTENTVIVNTKQGMGVLYKIADCVRMCFSSARDRRSARTGRRPRKCDRDARYFSNSFLLSFTFDHSSASPGASLRSMIGFHTLESSALIAVNSF